MKKRPISKSTARGNRIQRALVRKTALPAGPSAPLQVIILRHAKDIEGVELESAAERAFRGGATPSGYLATGEDLGVEIRVFNSPPDRSALPERLLGAACHTLVVSIIDSGALSDDTFLDWIAKSWGVIRNSG